MDEFSQRCSDHFDDTQQSALSELDRETFAQVIASLSPNEWTWNEKLAEEIPLEIQFMDNGATVIMHPAYSIGTMAVFGRQPLDNTTVAYWEVIVPAVYGTSVMFGIGRKSARTYSMCHFEPLIGVFNDLRNNNGESMGLSHFGVAFGGKFNGRLALKPRCFCPGLKDQRTSVGLLFHGPEGWLAYYVDDVPQGIAFTDIDASREKYYPMVSSTAQRSVFTLGRQLVTKLCKTLSESCVDAIVRQLSTTTNDSALRRNAQLWNLPPPIMECINRRMRWTSQESNLEANITNNNEEVPQEECGAEKNEESHESDERKRTADTTNWTTSLKRIKIV